jgi:hypothetical protein
MLTDFQSVNAIRDLAVRARLLDACTEVAVFQRDAVLVAARSINHLPGRDGTVGVNPVAPSPTEGGGQVGDLLAIAVYRYWREFSHTKQGQLFSGLQNSETQPHALEHAAAQSPPLFFKLAHAIVDLSFEILGILEFVIYIPWCAAIARGLQS